MGNELNNQIKDIKEEYITEVINEDKNNILYRYYKRFSSDDSFLNKKGFSQLTKISDEKILDDIYELFCDKKDQLSFDRLRKFYASFKNPKLKYILLPFVIFGNQNKIKKEEYMNHFTPFLERGNLYFIEFINDGFINKIKETNQNDNKEEYMSKSLFIDKSKVIYNEKLSDFKFLEDIPSSSNIINKKLIDIKPFNCICDCLMEKIENKNKKEKFEQMRVPFNNDKEAVENGHMNLKSFEKIITELRVKKKLINLVIRYLKFQTMKDYINFEDFKYLFSNIDYSVSITGKKKFLFEMILSIANEKSTISIKKLYNILQIKGKDGDEEKRINLESYEDPALNKEIKSYIFYMGILGFLPYFRYGMKPIDDNHKKQLILYILNKKSILTYLEDNFDKCTSFYPINYNFWKNLIKSKENMPNKIDNSIIAEEDPILNLNSKVNNKTKKTNEKTGEDKTLEKINKSGRSLTQKKIQIEKNNVASNNKPKKGQLQKGLIYGKHFIIVCGELFKKISEYYELDYIIELTKTTKYLPPEKKEEKEEKSKLNFNINFLYKKEKEEKNTIVHMVDFYPVKTLQILLTDLIKFVEKEKSKAESSNKGEKEDIKIEREKQEENFSLERKKAFKEELKYVKYMHRKGIIDKNEYDEKIDLLNKKYKDLPNEDDKKIKSTKLKKSEFLKIFKDKYKDIIIKNKNNIKKDTKYRNGTQIKEMLIHDDPTLNKDNFDIIYSTFKDTFYKPNVDETFEDNNIDDFVMIIIDKKNELGQTNLSILEENEEIYYSNINEYENKVIITKSELKKIKAFRLNEEKEKEKKEKSEKELEKKGKEKDKKEKEKQITPPYGMKNFGNTCYFNSVNQIFVNLPILQELFLNPKINYFINKKNKFGYKGKFINAFIPLYLIYPSKISEKILDLRVLVKNLKDTFNNNNQQDANEYLNFVLESLHEELNLKSNKKYIIDRDDNYKFNTEEELGDIALANNLRRNVSFIDSIFMFQLKSNLTCRKCNLRKVNFENNYVLDLPLSLCRIITVVVNLYRLPFKYKIYYDKINKDFQEYLRMNEDKNIMNNLLNYYIEKLNYDEKKQHVVKVNFEFEYERNKTIKDLTSLLRNISLLEIEPENYKNLIDNEEISENLLNHYTELIVYSSISNKLIKPNTELDKFVDKNDKIFLDIYEVLNTNGYYIINNLNNFEDLNRQFTIFSHIIKSSKISEIKSLQNINYFKADYKIYKILSLNDKLIYHSEKLYTNNLYIKKDQTNKIILIEYLIPIVHYHRNLNQGNENLFVDFYHSHIKEFPLQFIVFNNTKINQITPKYLYNYIWDLNSLYMNHPNKKTEDFWWNSEPNINNNIKKCYPFVLRIVRRKPNSKHLYECAQCQWYKFCIGCIIFPDDKEIIKIDSNSIIFVDWCNSFMKEEIKSCNFESKKFTKEEVTKCIELLYENKKNKLYKSIYDCFDLFFEKELLEDPLYCRNCGGPEDFSKNYEINKLPYVFILSLKRFKFNENNNFKLKQLITFPIHDFELKNKKYDLFGIIYHYGELNTGHYNSVIKKDNKWFMCDDTSVYEIEENKIMNSNAYVLFYISNDSINTYSYYNNLKSLMEHNIGDKKKKLEIKPKNFFKGEPVKTRYGEGYVYEDYFDDFQINENNNKDDNKNLNKIDDDKNLSNKTDKNNNGMIKIKFDFGFGTINVNNVEKQILEDKL